MIACYRASLSGEPKGKISYSIVRVHGARKTGTAWMRSDISKIMILGAGGRLGTALIRSFHFHTDYELVAVVHRSTLPLAALKGVKVYQAELTERAVVKNLCLEELPDVIINAAALSDVDYCEAHREEAWKVNVRIVEYALQMCRLYDIALVHFSTDYVFDGTAGPYREEDQPHPINYYGRTKLASENLCRTSPERTLVLRTNVLYGNTHKPTFVHWVLQKLQQQQPFAVVTDQYSNPTLLDDVAAATVTLVQQQATGLYHVGGTEWLSRYAFAKMIAEVFGYDPALIRPITTAALQQRAKRPLKAGLRTARIEQTFHVHLTHPQQGLQLMKKQMEKAKTE